MPAASPLSPTGQFHHDPAREPRITRAYPDTHAFDLTLGACALLDPDAGTAWIHTDGTMTTTGNPEIGDQLATLVQQWDATGRPSVGDWTMLWRSADSGDPAGLLLPYRWRLRRADQDRARVHPESGWRRWWVPVASIVRE
jgi:hypothetical protein